jgi:hypothetical protein
VNGALRAVAASPTDSHRLPLQHSFVVRPSSFDVLTFSVSVFQFFSFFRVNGGLRAVAASGFQLLPPTVIDCRYIDLALRLSSSGLRLLISDL